jgi:hypothetical protein
MKTKITQLSIILFLITVTLKAQTTHTINFPATGANTINVSCSVGDVLIFKSSSTPYAIRIFRNPTPNFTVTPTGTSTAYTVTATDTSYSSIVSISPSISYCTGKIILPVPTSIQEKSANNTSVFLYPNPVSTKVKIYGLKDLENVSIFDINGNLINESSFQFYNNELDVSSFTSGVYYIKAEEISFKFIKVN